MLYNNHANQDNIILPYSNILANGKPHHAGLAWWGVGQNGHQCGR